jgi:hypothetical protein
VDFKKKNVQVAIFSGSCECQNLIEITDHRKLNKIHNKFDPIFQLHKWKRSPILIFVKKEKNAKMKKIATAFWKSVKKEMSWGMKQLTMKNVNNK